MNWQSFRRYALWCWHQLLTLGLALLVIVAAMVGVSRELLPVVDVYRPRLEAALSRELGMPVTVQRLEGEADGLQLFLHLSRLDLHDPAAPGTVLLRVPDVEVRPQVWQSLFHLELRVDVRMRGLNLHVDQRPDGGLQLRELAGLASRDAATVEKTLRFVLSQPVLAVSESRINVDMRDLPDLALTRVELVNRNDGDVHRMSGRMHLPDTRDALAFQLELQGDPLHWQQHKLKMWGHLPVMALDGWMPPLSRLGEPYGIRMERLTGGGHYWLEFDRGQLTAVSADVDWRDLRMTRDGAPRHLEGLRGQLAWHRNAVGWQLTGEHLQGRIDGMAWPLPALAVRAGPRSLSVAARNTNIAGTLRLLSSVPMPEAIANWVHEASPAGQVAGLRADLAPREEGGWALRRLDAVASGLTVRPVEAHPGVRNLDGWVRWTPDRAWAGVTMRQGELQLPDFLRESVPVFHLDGRIRLARDGDGWRVDSDTLQGANADFGTSALVSISLPADAPPRLSIAATLTQARLDQAWRYVPWHIAGDRTLAWLRKSLTAGMAPHGALLYEGPVHADPDRDPGRFQLELATQGGSLDYAAGWPGLRGLDAVLTIDGARLMLSGGQARLLDGTVGEGLVAQIADLHHPVLDVSGRLTSTGGDLARLFRDSPLARRVPGLPDILLLEGSFQGDLALSMALPEGVPDVTVTARMRDNRLQLIPAKLVANHLHGEVQYSSRTGLRSDGLDAELLEAPVHATIRSEGGEHQTVYVDASGVADIAALHRWLAAPLLDLMSGRSPYAVHIAVPGGGGGRLQVDSSLAGVRVALPAPLGKAASETVPFRYQLGLGSGDQLGRVQYGSRLSGGLVWSGRRLDRALLRFDSTAAAWPERSGLEIEGRMAHLDVGEWRPVLAHLQKGNSPTVTAGTEATTPDLTRLDLEVQDLQAEGWRLRNAHVDLTRSPSAWQLALDSDELAATARVPDDAGSAIGLGFTRVQWPLPPSPAKAPAGNGGLNPVSGLGNRALVINGQGLHLTAWPGLGALDVKASVQPLPTGVRVEDIALHGPLLDFHGTVDWQWRGGASTRVQGKAESTDINGLFTAFGVTPPLISKRATCDLDLTWPGAPDRAAFGLLDGHVSLGLEQGRLLNVSASTSASRIFGWFSLANLQRRLKGDFADVTRRGLAFDSISLEGPLDAGVMAPAEVQMKGPTLQARGQGRLDIGRRKVDQQYVVTMPVTSAVPLAAVMMAGPVVGGAVAAAQMAFDKQIGRATELHYRVSGDWDNPQVERLSGHDAAPATPPVPPPSGAHKGASVNVATKETPAS